MELSRKELVFWISAADTAAFASSPKRTRASADGAIGGPRSSLRAFLSTGWMRSPSRGRRSSTSRGIVETTFSAPANCTARLRGVVEPFQYSPSPTGEFRTERIASVYRLLIASFSSSVLSLYFAMIASHARTRSTLFDEFNIFGRFSGVTSPSSARRAPSGEVITKNTTRQAVKCIARIVM